MHAGRTILWLLNEDGDGNDSTADGSAIRTQHMRF
jgi:hypothetical protein